MKTSMYIVIGLFLTYLVGVFVDAAILTTNTSQNDIEQAATYLKTESLPTPPKEFYHDGCTSAPDYLLWHDFRDACFNHDIGYWAGGELSRKEHVDLRFYEEVSETGPLGPAFGAIMYYAVHYLGNNFTSYILGSNWGYGYND